MRNVVLFLLPVILTITGSGCQEEKKLAEIRFCADIMANDPCVGEDFVFMQGSIVWAQLMLKSGFSDTLVTGNLYGYQNGKRQFIESTVHKISEDQSIVMEPMFFNTNGDFEVEFVGSKGNLLDKKGLEIW